MSGEEFAVGAYSVLAGLVMFALLLLAAETFYRWVGRVGDRWAAARRRRALERRWAESVGTASARLVALPDSVQVRQGVPGGVLEFSGDISPEDMARWVALFEARLRPRPRLRMPSHAALARRRRALARAGGRA